MYYEKSMKYAKMLLYFSIFSAIIASFMSAIPNNNINSEVLKLIQNQQMLEQDGVDVNQNNEEQYPDNNIEDNNLPQNSNQEETIKNDIPENNMEEQQIEEKNTIENSETSNIQQIPDEAQTINEDNELQGNESAELNQNPNGDFKEEQDLVDNVN